MAKPKNGEKVKVNYKGTLDDGTVFDSSEGKEPLEFEIGEGKIIPGFEKCVLEMEKGEKKSIKIECKDAYGPVDPQAFQKVPKDKLPPDVEVKPGMQLQVMTQQGFPVVVVVTDVTDEEVTLDANHPLAGRDLNFEIELVEITAGK